MNPAETTCIPSNANARDSSIPFRQGELELDLLLMLFYATQSNPVQSQLNAPTLNSRLPTLSSGTS
jgi:hypothetical protein